MKRTLLFLLILAVGSVLAAAVVGEVVATKTPSAYVKTAAGHIVPRAAATTQPGAVKRFASAFVKGPGTASVVLVLPDGKTTGLLTFALPAEGLTPVQASVRVGPAQDAAQVTASINPEELADEP